MATIAQLEETARQEDRTAEDYDGLAERGCAQSETYKLLADMSRDRRDEALLAVKAIKEAAQYTQFDCRREPNEK